MQEFLLGGDHAIIVEFHQLLIRWFLFVLVFAAGVGTLLVEDAVLDYLIDALVELLQFALQHLFHFLIFLLVRARGQHVLDQQLI